MRRSVPCKTNFNMATQKFWTRKKITKCNYFYAWRKCSIHNEPFSINFDGNFVTEKL